MADLKRALPQETYEMIEAARTASSITVSKLTVVVNKLKWLAHGDDSKSRTALMLVLKFTRKIEAENNRKGA